MSQKIIGFVGLAVVAAFVAFSIPAGVDSVPGTTESTATLADGESEIITDYLRIQVSDPTNTDVNVIASNTKTGDLDNATITEGSTSELILNSDTINVTNQDSTNQQATLTVSYDRSFGWDPSTLWFLDNIGLLLVLLSFISVMAGVMMVMP